MRLTSGKENAFAIEFPFFPHFFLISVGFLGFKQISSQHRRGGPGRHRPRWSCSMAPASPNDQRPKCRTSAGPNLFFLRRNICSGRVSMDKSDKSDTLCPEVTYEAKPSDDV